MVEIPKDIPADGLPPFATHCYCKPLNLCMVSRSFDSELFGVDARMFFALEGESAACKALAAGIPLSTRLM